MCVIGAVQEGAHVGTVWLRHCAISRMVAGSILDGVIGIFQYGPGVESACNRNEYQEYFLGGKGGRCVGLSTLPPSFFECLEIWEPHLVEPSGPVQTCNGIVLTFFFFFFKLV